METKADIRKQYKLRRDSMSEEQRKDFDQRIFRRLTEHPTYKNAKELYTYVSFGSEADTRALLAHAWSCGKKVAVPKVLSKEEMAFYYVESMDDFQSGIWGILEPEEKNPVTDQPALVIMPLLAFDNQFHRVGYGGGYYDRFLSAHPDHQTIALAYSIQEVDFIPTESIDICPKVIITEECIYE